MARNNHAEQDLNRTRAQDILSSLSAEEAGIVVAALYDYSKSYKHGDEDPNHMLALSKGISSAALAGHAVPMVPGQYH